MTYKEAKISVAAAEIQ